VQVSAAQARIGGGQSDPAQALHGARPVKSIHAWCVLEWVRRVSGRVAVGKEQRLQAIHLLLFYAPCACKRMGP